MLKKIANKFWFNDSNSNLGITSGKEISFLLKYKNITVGNLSYSDGEWKFEYTEEFKTQEEISPLINFPMKEKSYSSKSLWPFFVARIPSNAQLMLPDKEETDLIEMLKKYGSRSIANPFELQAAF